MQSIKSIAVALGGEVAGRDSVRVPGPGHSRKDRSMRVKFSPDGSFVTFSEAGDDWRECRDYVRAKLGLPNEWRRHDNDDQPIIRMREGKDDEPARIRSALKRWETSIPIAGTPAEAYLNHRGVSYSGEALRYRPNDGCMYALVTDVITAEPCGCQQTFIDRDGKPKPAIINDQPRKRTTHGRAKNAVVRLSPDDAVHYGLGIGEGVETCLATGFTPIWACLSASTMKAFPVLDGIDCLTIFADRDHAGMSAANECGRRWHEADKEIEIVAPSEIGADFADEMEAA